MALNRNQVVKPVKKLRKLVKSMDRRAGPRKIHSLRSNSRRLEAMVDAFRLDGDGVRSSLLSDLVRCRKRAGKVRDMDVLTGFASHIHSRDEEECLVQLLEYLGSKRRKYAQKLSSELRRVRRGLRKGLKRASPVLLEHADAQQANPSNGEPAVGPAAAALQIATELGKPKRLGKSNLHQYRLKVKELRNLLQLGNSHNKLVDDLGKVKQAIGEWHDWEELTSVAGKVLDHGPRCAVLAELKRVSKEKYDRALRLAEDLRKSCLRRSGGSPSDRVWEAIATLTN